MKFLSIKYKLLLLILASNLLLGGIMFFMLSWQFDKSFKNYSNELTLQRMEYFSKVISLEYSRRYESWDWLQQNPREFAALMQQSFRRQSHLNQQLSRHHQHLELTRGVYLLDKQGNQLFGREPARTRTLNLHWVSVDLNGENIGYLGYPKKFAMRDGIEKSFAIDLSNEIRVWTLLVVFISLMLSLPMAIAFIKPIKKIRNAMKLLSEGNYQAPKLPGGKSDELAQLCRSTEVLARTLSKNRDARNRWVASISHELRTPLAILRCELEGLADGVMQPDEETFTYLNEEVIRLAGIIDDLYQLSLSDIGGMNYRLKPLDLHALVEQFVQRHRNSGAFTQVNFQLKGKNEPLWIEGDRDRLQQLLVNLLKNSAEYGPEETIITIDWQLEASEVRLIWSDNGTNMNGDELSKLAKPMYRADSAVHSHHDGAGIGLSICHQVMVGHNGQLNFDLTEQNGLKVICHFPN